MLASSPPRNAGSDVAEIAVTVDISAVRES
jgi:hypothetical protein